MVALEAAGVGAAAFVSTGRHLFTDMDPVVWLTGAKPMGRAAALVRDGEVTLLVERETDLHRATKVCTVGSVEQAADPLTEAARRLGKSASRLGVAGGRKLNAMEMAVLTSTGALEMRSVDAALDGVARRKDAEELANLRTATEWAEDAYDVLLDQLEPGMTDVDAEALVEQRLRALGSADAFIFLSGSRRNRAVQHPWGRVLTEGDVLLMEISPSCGGTFTQICRTVAIGEPPPALVSGHAVLQEALAGGIAACAAGTPVAKVVSVIDDRLIAEGFGDYCKPPFMRVRGHGMGFGSIKPGDFLSRNDDVLEEGDTFVLHPNQMLPTTGYLMCGEPVVVGSGTGQIFSRGIAELGSVVTR